MTVRYKAKGVSFGLTPFWVLVGLNYFWFRATAAFGSITLKVKDSVMKNSISSRLWSA